MAIEDLFRQDVKVINIGLDSFRESLEKTGTPVAQVDWRPPLPVPPQSWLRLEAHREAIASANQEAVNRVLAGKPVLTGLGRALDCVPGMRPDLFLHAGPPVSWQRMCGPMRGAVMGAMIYEGLAATPEEAEKLAAGGRVAFAPCHEHAAVGPMAGIISPRMPVFIVRNETFGNCSYSTMNEGLGKVLRYGAYSPEVIERLRWMEETLFPALARCLDRTGPIDLRHIIAQALHMGDEVHNRNRAATSLLFRQLAPGLARTADSPETAAKVLEFINGNDHFFLNLAMAAGKAVLDAARDIPASSLVVAMARNGTDFGVQLAGTGGRWFTGPAPVPDALFFPGFTKADANPDIGDSAITETAGLGGFAIAAAPAIVQFVGGSVADAVNYTTQMYEITLAENKLYQMPALDFRGTPTGIDVLRVIETSILPFIDTGVAHREPGVGQVGAGVLSAPPEPFQAACAGLAETLAEPSSSA